MCIKSLKIGVNRNVIIIIKIKLGPIYIEGLLCARPYAKTLYLYYLILPFYLAIISLLMKKMRLYVTFSLCNLRVLRACK